jgi:hypothetical protein
MTILAGRSGVEVDGPVPTSAIKKLGIYTHDYEQSTAYFMVDECIPQLSGESWNNYFHQAVPYHHIDYYIAYYLYSIWVPDTEALMGLLQALKILPESAYRYVEPLRR